MTSLKDLKQRAYIQLQNLLNKKIETLLYEIKSAKESRNSDTKSSAGDKYETGREMVNIEIQKNEAQLSKTNILKKNLSLIDINRIYNRVEFGSFVKTNIGIYFISIGLGKIKDDKTEYYAISAVSPIGKLLIDKKIGDTFQLQDREFIIEEIA